MYFFRSYIAATFGSQTKSSIFYDNTMADASPPIMHHGIY